MKKKVSKIQAILTVAFVSVLLLSNIVSSRLFSLFGIEMTSAIVIFPITYILSDLFSEIYGYKWSRMTCYIAFATNLLAVFFFLIISKLPPVIEEQANAFDTILIGTVSCSFASFFAFVVGDFANDKIFEKMKKKHQGIDNQKGFVFRAIISSVFGELVDSCIYLPIAFLLINPIMTPFAVLTMIFTQVVIKVLYEMLIMPITIFLVKKVSKYEKESEIL